MQALMSDQISKKGNNSARGESKLKTVHEKLRK